MRLLILINNYENYPGFHDTHVLLQGLQAALPGSRLYGPGFSDYATNDVEGIMEQLGGADKFDAIYCCSLGRPLLGEPVHFAITEKYPDIPVNLWFFPTNLNKVRLPKILQPIDHWHCTPAEWARILTMHGFGYVIHPVPPFISTEEFNRTFPAEVRERVVFIPFAAARSPERYRDFGLEKIHDVMMSGAQYSDFYPVRAQMLEAFRKSDIALYEPKHPGYARFLRHNPYPRIVNASRISAFCNSRLHMHMAKLVEAMGCRTAALCDFFYGAEHMGMVADTHFILADGTNCVEKAKEYLREPGRLQEMYDAGQKLFLERHTSRQRAAEFAEMLPALLNGHKALSWAELSPNLKVITARRVAVHFGPDTANAATAHVLDAGLDCNKSTWTYWRQLGNLRVASPQECEGRTLPPTVHILSLASNWLHIFRSEYLKKLARDMRATNFLEIGTGMGFQSFVWAGWLLAEQKEGHIITLDILGHDDTVVSSNPAMPGRAVTRRKLWAGTAESRYIQFIHRGHEPIPTSPAFDLVFIDQNNTFTSVISDFKEIQPLLHPKSVLVVNNYCHDYPGVMDAVNHIAKKNVMTVKHINFLPEPEGLAVCGFKPTHKAT